jgi:phospholipase C
VAITSRDSLFAKKKELFPLPLLRRLLTFNVAMPPPSFLLRAAAAAASAAVACAWGEQIEHIIVFMQENRAYDHYYGTHQGVRGFNDRAAIPLRSGLDSLYQPVDQNDLTKYQLPFHTSTMSTSSICMPAPAMAYPSDIGIWNGGRLDSWNVARSMGLGPAFWTRDDLQYYSVLWDNFAVGDQCAWWRRRRAPT